MNKGVNLSVSLETGFWFIEVHPPNSATSVNTQMELHPRATKPYRASVDNIIQAVVQA